MASKRATVAFLAGLAALAAILCFLLVVPFLKPIVLAGVLAILVFPLHSRLLRRTGNRNVSAALSTALVVLLLAAIGFFLGRAMASELRGVYLSLRGAAGAKERLTVFLVHGLDRGISLAGGLVPISANHLQAAISNQIEKLIGGLLATGAGMLGSLASFFANALICLFVLFFFLRDGRSILRRAAALLPLRRNQVARLGACVRETLGAIVYGTLAIAALQGILAGLAFYFLGLASPVLWGTITALCALLPVIGTGFVFLPALVMLALGSHWVRAAILLIWALVVVHPVDNILRPFLIGGRARLSTLYVFLSLVGGVKAFGAVGLFLGPLIVAVTVAVLTLLREEARSSRVKIFKRVPARKEAERAAVS